VPSAFTTTTRCWSAGVVVLNGATLSIGGESHLRGDAVALCAAASLAIGAATPADAHSVTAGKPKPLPSTAQINAMLPDAIRSKGTLAVAGSFAFPPDDYVSASGNLVGFVKDVVTAIAKEAGLTVQFVKTPFIGVLTGIQAGRYDAGIIFADTKLREQQASFVNFLNEGDSWVVRGGFSGSGTPCGHPVGAGAGSNEALLLPTLSQTDCVSQGKPPLDIHVYPNNPEAVVALQSQRVDAVLSATDVANWTARTSGGAFMKLPKQVPGSAITDGMALPRQPLSEAKALRWACQRAVQDGTYLGILKTWGVGSLHVKLCTINGAKK